MTDITYGNQENISYFKHALYLYFKMRKFAFAPLPDIIYCAPRAKITGVCALYKVENLLTNIRDAQTPVFALGAQYILCRSTNIKYWTISIIVVIFGFRLK